MRAVIQRVKNACLKVDGVVISEIGKGYVVFFGVKQGDDQSKADYIVRKTAAMRLFEDGNGKMNLSLSEVGGEVLFVCSSHCLPSADTVTDRVFRRRNCPTKQTRCTSTQRKNCLSLCR